MPKNLWECAKEGCGEKALVPEDVIPVGWYGLQAVYRCPGTSDLEENVNPEHEEDCEGCLVYDYIEACCIEHALEVSRESIEALAPIREVENE